MDKEIDRSVQTAATSMQVLLQQMTQIGASDMHLSAGLPATVRINDRMTALDERGKLRPEEVHDLAYSVLTPDQMRKFEHEKELDISFGVSGLGRFRLNFFYQRGTVALAVRLLPRPVRSFAETGLPEAPVVEMCSKTKGLILVTGSTGSGKSSTLASMVDWINHNRECHVMTIEDPIEYTHVSDKAVIHQREVGTDTRSYPRALKYVLRQDPDVILIGEMRDLETIEAALRIAETGHLVLATLHTSDAVQTVNRIVDVFPAHQQQQVRIQLSFVLLGVLCQQLIPRSDTQGRVLAAELMLANHAIRALIREGNPHQMYSMLRTGRREGMQTMNQSLAFLVNQKVIRPEDALACSSESEELRSLIQSGSA